VAVHQSAHHHCLLTGGDYAMGGGFWGDGAAAAVKYELYLPLVLRNS
jgi:hypothetical protein